MTLCAINNVHLRKFVKGTHTHTLTYIQRVPSPQDVEPSRNEAYEGEQERWVRKW